MILAKLIPWEEIEKRYARSFSQQGIGAPAKPVRLALGSLIIKEKLGLTDEETVLANRMALMLCPLAPIIRFEYPVDRLTSPE